MALTGTLGQAYRDERAQRPARKPRTPLLVHVGRLAARLIPGWATFRTFLLTLAGLVCLTTAAWELHHIAGLAAGGVSLLLLEYLMRGDE